jgi:WD40 repeat protein
VRLLPDGKRWAASTKQGFVLGTWNGRELAVTHRIKPETRSHMALAISPDGQRLAIGYHAIEIWDVAVDPPEFVHRFGPKVTPAFRGFAFTADGETLLSWQEEHKQIRRWRVADGSELPPLVDAVETIRDMAATPDGRRVVFATGYSAAQLWDISAPEPRHLRTFARDKNSSVSAVDPLAISADGKTVWTGGRAGTGRLLSFTDDEEAVRESLLGVLGLFCAAVSPDGRRLLTGGSHGELELTHVTDDGSRAIHPFDHAKWIDRAQFTPDSAGL